MKTNLYILLLFLFSVSLLNAQANEVLTEIDSNKTTTVLEGESINDTSKNDTLLIDVTEFKETIVRSASDIRIYLNRERKVGNISFVFPKINKAVKA